MKKTFKLMDLDCANCAAKMEAAIQKIEGVESASVNFMSQKLTMDAPAELMETILNDVQAAITKIEPHCKLVR